MTRDGLMAMRGASKNQLHALAQWPVQIASAREHLETVLAMLDEQLKQLDEELKAVLRDGAWAASAAHLQSITGIGLVTASWLLVGTVNFTTCRSAESAAHYAGLAPMKRESGTSVRGREAIGHAGNGRLRTALYMATMSAVQHNEVIKTFYTRLKGGRESGEGGAMCMRAEIDAPVLRSSDEGSRFRSFLSEAPVKPFDRTGA